VVNGSLRGAKEQRSFKPQAAGSIPAGRTFSSQRFGDKLAAAPTVLEQLGAKFSRASRAGVRLIAIDSILGFPRNPKCFTTGELARPA
jgi:hypothetical protein